MVVFKRFVVFLDNMCSFNTCCVVPNNLSLSLSCFVVVVFLSVNFCLGGNKLVQLCQCVSGSDIRS